MWNITACFHPLLMSTSMSHLIPLLSLPAVFSHSWSRSPGQNRCKSTLDYLICLFHRSLRLSSVRVWLSKLQQSTASKEQQLSVTLVICCTLYFRSYFQFLAYFTNYNFKLLSPNFLMMECEINRLLKTFKDVRAAGLSKAYNSQHLSWHGDMMTVKTMFKFFWSK